MGTAEKLRRDAHLHAARLHQSYTDCEVIQNLAKYARIPEVAVKTDDDRALLKTKLSDLALDREANDPSRYVIVTDPLTWATIDALWLNNEYELRLKYEVFMRNKVYVLKITPAVEALIQGEIELVAHFDTSELIETLNAEALKNRKAFNL